MKGECEKAEKGMQKGCTRKCRKEDFVPGED
jgi:hypothetical protein